MPQNELPDAPKQASIFDGSASLSVCEDSRPLLSNKGETCEYAPPPRVIAPPDEGERERQSWVDVLAGYVGGVK